MDPSLRTMKRLFALSQNQCAFPDCSFPIVEESGTVTGIVCHIKAARSGGPRYDPDQIDEDRHSFSNLMLLCARHSKFIDSEPEQYTVGRLLEIKRRHEQNGPVEISDFDRRMAELVLKAHRTIDITASGHVMVDSPGSVQTSNLIIKKQKGKVTITPPLDSVASSLSHRNYIRHLIERYNEFASQQPGRKFRHAVIYASIRARFGATWNFIPISNFEDVVTFLQQRIDRTRLGSMNRAKGTANYSLFAEYRQKYEREHPQSLT